MIKTLHKRLTFLYSLTTGLILTFVVIGMALVSSNDRKKKALDDFQNQILTISSRLQSEAFISHTWLAQTEGINNLIIYIEDNLTPLLYSGSWSPPTDRSVLIENARAIALEEHINIKIAPVSSSIARSSIFKLDGEHNDSYLGTVLLFNTNKGFKSLVLLSYSAPQNTGLWNQWFIYFVIDFLGIIALALVSWKFVGNSLQPIEENNRKQNEFIAAASHELRSPLAVIQAGLSTLPQTSSDESRFLDTAQKECKRMSRLINDMLLLASASAKTWPLQISDVDIDTLLISTFESFEILTKEKHQTLSLMLPKDPLPAIKGDKERLEQVLTILLNNAISYTPEYKNIILRCSLKNTWIYIEVEDEGKGIPDSLKASVFERFYRVDQSRNDKKNFGLGLSIAKELVSLHKGKIYIEDGEKGGCRFIIKLKV